ncbi:MAG: [FeFe] hydrogenase H-cluster maturation GTPase HydF [Acholeplasmatales bacterium]|nr:[FeFe] hydrogenase H-cluster maturation GTPase HydF [Acholeplasmatales bacterium]
MSLNDTVFAQRIHIGFFGLRNAGKSSLVNKITNQEMSLVSDIKGTTTDPVKKSMELLPLGPVVIIDTPGFDDIGPLGDLRVRKTKEMLNICDIVVFVTENLVLSKDEEDLLNIIKTKEIPYLIVHNKVDLLDSYPNNLDNEIYISTNTNIGIEELKEAIGRLNLNKKEIHYVSDFVKKGDTIILVTPIDKSAPKGRMILPQQLAIRDLLDKGAVAIVTQVEELSTTLNNLKNKPVLVVTDSQVFSKVMKIVPEDIPLTSFSILMARYKGFLDTAIKGAMAIDSLKNQSKILISEGCTQHRQCEDIGTVKLPNWFKKYTNKEFVFEFSSGHGFPTHLSSYSLIIHCGGCMLNDKEVENRMNQAIKANIPFTNYGISIAYMNGILQRSIKPIYNE